MNLRLASLSLILAACGTSSPAAPDSPPAPAGAPTATPSPAALAFAPIAVGQTAAAQTVTITNTGTAALTLAGIAVGGVNPTAFTAASACGTELAAGASCTISVAFAPSTIGAASAALTVTDDAPDSPQMIALTGTAIAATTADCAVATGACTPLVLTGDSIAAGLFHGYADPSMRKDPNSGNIYLAYSWPHTLSDHTRVVDLHLAVSSNGGGAFAEVGPLYQSKTVTQSASTAYAPTNDTSTEVVDLLPIPLTGAAAGRTLWVQAHQSYLVAPTGAIYGQLDATGIISVTAVVLASPADATAPQALLALSAAATPEARLGGGATDPSLDVTANLATIAAAPKCSNWGQPALWYAGGALYLMVECTETVGTGTLDGNELAHYVFVTAPKSADATTWTWSFVGEVATPTQAVQLGKTEGTAYEFLTEPEFVAAADGSLLMLATPAVFAPAGATQPVIQYGCRTFPIALTPTAVTLTVAPTTSVTESDLYTAPNEGPAACTYDAASATGIVLGRKYEGDPTLGFDVIPLATGISP